MRVDHATHRWLWQTGTLPAVVFIAGGCTSFPSPFAGDTPPTPAVSTPSPDTAARSAQDYAARFAGMTGPSASPAAAVADAEPHNPLAVPEVRWIDLGGKPAGDVNPKTGPAVLDQPGLVKTALPTLPDDAGVERAATLERVRKENLGQTGSPMRRAIESVAKCLSDPDHQPTEADLQGLNAEQRSLIERYREIVSGLGRRMAKGDPAATPEAVAHTLAGALPEPPVKISEVRLCKRVRGFGVYDTFGVNTFLAGRSQKVIVYLEVTNYKSVKAVNPAGEGVYRVKLSQELSLHNLSDGLVVWKQPSVEIPDESRNQRRDFFVVQLVELPSTLGVGKYSLKVRLSDLQGDSVDEAIVPISVVADPLLLSAGGSSNR